MHNNSLSCHLRKGYKWPAASFIMAQWHCKYKCTYKYNTLQLYEHFSNAFLWLRRPMNILPMTEGRSKLRTKSVISKKVSIYKRNFVCWIGRVLISDFSSEKMITWLDFEWKKVTRGETGPKKFFSKAWASTVEPKPYLPSSAVEPSSSSSKGDYGTTRLIGASFLLSSLEWTRKKLHKLW